MSRSIVVLVTAHAFVVLVTHLWIPVVLGFSTQNIRRSRILRAAVLVGEAEDIINVEAAENAAENHGMKKTTTDLSKDASSNTKRRVMKTLNPFRLSPLESEYLSGVALQIGRFQASFGLVAVTVDKIDSSPLPKKLRVLASQSQIVPRTMAYVFGRFGGSETVVKEGVSTTTTNPTNGKIVQKEGVLFNTMCERLAYMLLEDLDNIKQGIYPLPSELRLSGQHDPQKAIPDALQQLSDAISFAARDTYFGQVEYGSEPNQPSKYLQELSQGLDLPEYYLHDFHSVPGGFLAPEHPPMYDFVSEAVFYGSHFMSRRMMFRPLSLAMKKMGLSKANGWGLRLLDLGTGNGSFVIQLQEAFPALAISGLDLSPAMLEYAEKSFKTSAVMRRSTAPPVKLTQANMENIPEGGETFEFVTQSNCFHEMPETAIRNTAREIARVLKPGGVFVHHDAVQMVDDSSVASASRAVFDNRYNEPFIFDYMSNVDLDKIFAEHDLHPFCPPAPYRQAAVRCYQK